MGFGGINIALTALYAQRQALDTTGHNIANANTEGYTRQRVDLAAQGGPVTPAMYATWSGGGAGVRVDSIQRMNDHFLQLRSLQEHSANANMQQTNTILGRAELAFAEPSDNGIQEQLANFWSAWDDVANNPDDLATRTQLLEKTQTVTAGFRQAASDLTSLRNSAIGQVGDDAAQINSLAKSIAQLNEGIDTAVNGGLQPSDLEDQRDNLINKLSQLTGVTLRDNRNGMVDVFIGSSALVRGRDSNSLHMDQTAGVPSLKWDLDNSTVGVAGGSVGALLDAATKTIPAYMTQLDKVANAFKDTVNAQQMAGVDLNSAPSSTPTGKKLLNGTGAADIDIDPTFQPEDVAAAAVNGGRVDGSNALIAAELGQGANSPDAAYRSFIDRLGVDTQRAGTQASIQATITQQTDAASQSAAGVNLDEEMANMVSYQHAYDAAARFMTAIDSNLDTLIHNTGLVGR